MLKFFVEMIIWQCLLLLRFSPLSKPWAAIIYRLNYGCWSCHQCGGAATNSAFAVDVSMMKDKQELVLLFFFKTATKKFFYPESGGSAAQSVIYSIAYNSCLK